MNDSIINNIDITTNNKDIISVTPDSFENFYIANINKEGEEINYMIDKEETYYANFFMIKLLNKSEDDDSIIKRLLKKKDIVNIGINFTNGKYILFNIAKKRIAENGLLENRYEESFKDEDNNLCIIITDKNIKYKKELFA